MDALTRHRKIRLQALIDGKPYEGNQAKFATEAGLTKARITQLLDPSDSFGERAAQGLCDKLNLAERYFEHGFGASAHEMVASDFSNVAPAPTQALGQPTLAQALEVVAVALSQVPADKRQALLGVLATYSSQPAQEVNALTYLHSELAKTQARAGVLPSDIATGQPPGGKA